MKTKEVEIPSLASKEEFDRVWTSNREELCQLTALVDTVMARQEVAMKEVIKPLLYCWYGYIVALIVVPILMGSDGAVLVQCLGVGMFAGLIYTIFQMSSNINGESIKQILLTNTINQKLAEHNNEKQQHHSDH